MKKSIGSAIFLALFAVGCAPVSSSVPKGQKPVEAPPMFARGKVRASSPEIKGKDRAEAARDEVKKTYQILELTHDQESRLIETKELSIKLGVKSGAEATEVQVIVLIELGIEDAAIQSERVQKFKLDVVRDVEDGDTFTVRVPKGAEDAWVYIRKNDPRISIAYREK